MAATAETRTPVAFLLDVERRYPAEHYVLIDDKVRILTAIKQIWGRRVTTVFPRQGHYAHDPHVATFPAPDVTVERICDLLNYDLRALCSRTSVASAKHP